MIHLASLCLFASVIAAQGKVRVVSPAPVLNSGSAGVHLLSTTGSIAFSREWRSSLALSPRDEFGRALAEVGDVDGNGTTDFVVGVPGLDVSATPDRGGLRVFLLDALGGVIGERQIDSDDLSLLTRGTFGKSLAPLGDFDHDGVPDLIVGSPGMVVQGPRPTTPGQVFLLMLNRAGGVKSSVRIGQGLAGFTGTLDSMDEFGASVAALGDLDGDGVTDVAVGAMQDDDGGAEFGAIWILFLNADGTVKSHQKISATSGGFPGTLAGFDGFGGALAPLGDLDGDGIPDLAAGESGGDAFHGSLWILFLNADGTVRAGREIRTGSAGFPGTLALDCAFGSSCARLGDLDGDGRPELAVGAPNSAGRGSVWILSLLSDGTVSAAHEETRGTRDSSWGSAVAALTDRNHDGVKELFVGASSDSPSPDDFATIVDGVDDAAPGDVLLVKAGSYADPLTIDKPITIQAERGQSVTIAGRLVVTNVTSGSVQIRGVDVTAGVHLEDDSGLVWLEGGQVTADPLLYPTVFDVRRCDDVVLIDTRVTASNQVGLHPTFAAQNALEISGASELQAYGCTFSGADGVDYDCGVDVCAQPGGFAVNSTNPGDFLFLSGCTARGGKGIWNGAPISIDDCSSGGAALSSRGPSVVLDCELHGGAGGVRGGTPCAPAGPDYSLLTTLLPGSALRFSAGSPAREDENVTLTFDGPPLAPVYLFVGTQPLARYLPQQRGVQLVGAPHEIHFMGVTDAAGHLEVVRPQDPLLSGTRDRLAFLQAAYVHFSSVPPLGSGKLRRSPKALVLGSGSVLVTLDASL